MAHGKMRVARRVRRLLAGKKTGDQQDATASHKVRSTAGGKRGTRRGVGEERSQAMKDFFFFFLSCSSPFPMVIIVSLHGCPV